MPRHIEDEIQANVCTLLDMLSKSNGFVYFHVPNGGKRNIKEASRFKRLGVKSGIPDLVIIKSGCVYMIELKAPQGRLSVVQKDRIASLESVGVPVVVCRSVEDVRDTLSRWGVMK